VQDLTKDLNAKLGPLLDDVKTTTARANDTLSHVDSTLLENRPDVRATVVALRDTLAQLNQTLDQNSANIDELLDNIRMSTENLRALTETLERAPASLIRGIKVPERKPGER
jgi:ABC-type transporter Mla subunit MlaD